MGVLDAQASADHRIKIDYKIKRLTELLDEISDAVILRKSELQRGT